MVPSERVISIRMEGSSTLCSELERATTHYLPLSLSKANPQVSHTYLLEIVTSILQRSESSCGNLNLCSTRLWSSLERLIRERVSNNITSVIHHFSMAYLEPVTALFKSVTISAGSLRERQSRIPWHAVVLGHVTHLISCRSSLNI